MERRVWRCKQLFESWPQKPSGRYSCEALRWTANFRIDRADADVQQAWRCPVESNMKQLKTNCTVSHSGIAIRWERINEAKCIPSWEFAPHIGILGSLRYISSGSLSTAQHQGHPTNGTLGYTTRPCRGLGRDAIDACGQEVVPTCHWCFRSISDQTLVFNISPATASMSSARTSSSMYGTDCIPVNPEPPEPCESPSGITAYPP